MRRVGGSSRGADFYFLEGARSAVPTLGGARPPSRPAPSKTGFFSKKPQNGGSILGFGSGLARQTPYARPRKINAKAGPLPFIARLFGFGHRAFEGSSEPIRIKAGGFGAAAFKVSGFSKERRRSYAHTTARSNAQAAASSQSRDNAHDYVASFAFAARRSSGFLFASGKQALGSATDAVSSSVPRILRAFVRGGARIWQSVFAGSFSLFEKIGAARLKKTGIAAGVLVAASLCAFAIVQALPPRFPMPKSELLPLEESAGSLLLEYLSPELAELEEGSYAPPPPATLEIERYTVRPGDSIGSIAKKFRVSQDSIISMNAIKNSRSLRSGTELKIPNMDGLVHVVAKGESIASVSARYKIESTSLADANDLGTSILKPGQSLFIPGARLSESELKKVFGEYITWPLRGPLSSYFGYRPNPFTGVRSFHAGIDIVAAMGVPVRSAMDGRVADVGNNALYGNYVIINHADGVQTLYAHLSAYQVSRGASVGQGSIIGAVGNTGYSTGPHLHFGFFKKGSPQNPLKYLK